MFVATPITPETPSDPRAAAGNTHTSEEIQKMVNPHLPTLAGEFVGLTVEEALARVEQQRIDEIRRQIAAGTYLTEDKLEFVVDRMFKTLKAEAAERKEKEEKVEA